MRTGYSYELSTRMRHNFDPEFKPELTPQQMLTLGVFCGKYMTDRGNEFPKSWFKHAKLARSGEIVSLIILALAPAGRSPSGKTKDGSTLTIPACLPSRKPGFWRIRPKPSLAPKHRRRRAGSICSR